MYRAVFGVPRFSHGKGARRDQDHAGGGLRGIGCKANQKIVCTLCASTFERRKLIRQQRGPTHVAKVPSQPKQKQSDAKRQHIRRNGRGQAGRLPLDRVLSRGLRRRRAYGFGRSFAGAPIIIKGRLVGFINLIGLPIQVRASLKK